MPAGQEAPSRTSSCFAWHQRSDLSCSWPSPTAGGWLNGKGLLKGGDCFFHGFLVAWMLKEIVAPNRPNTLHHVCKLATTTGPFLREVPSLPEATSSTLYGPLSKHLSGNGFPPDLSLNKSMEPNIARCESHIRPQRSLGAPGCFHRCVSSRTALPEVTHPPAT